MSSESLNELFAASETDLDAISKEGWYVEHSASGSWWFRNKNTQQRQSVPMWIREMVFEAREHGGEIVRTSLRNLIGVEAPKKPRRKAGTND